VPQALAVADHLGIGRRSSSSRLGWPELETGAPVSSRVVPRRQWPAGLLHRPAVAGVAAQRRCARARLRRIYWPESAAAMSSRMRAGGKCCS
jgi:hypothetical protein